MAGISTQVGKDSPNLKQDVRTIQQLLNRYVAAGRPLLKVDGVAGPRTIQAIEEFQQQHAGLARPDGVVSPGGPTIRALLGTSPVHARLKIPAPSTTPKPPSGVVPSPDSTQQSVPATAPDQIAWGKKVTASFKHKVIEICQRLEISPDFLMACMALETGQTFDPGATNGTSNATGLIQCNYSRPCYDVTGVGQCPMMSRIACRADFPLRRPVAMTDAAAA